jgi:hypothetical protein
MVISLGFEDFEILGAMLKSLFSATEISVRPYSRVSARKK